LAKGRCAGVNGSMGITEGTENTRCAQLARIRGYNKTASIQTRRMNRKCPGCRSRNVRRSPTPEPDVTWRRHFLSPYVCRDCKLQFRVISRRTYRAAAVILATIVVAVIAIFLLDLILGRDTSGRRPRRSDGGPQQRVQVAAEPRFGTAARSLPSAPPDRGA
jgi:transposase-like protein